MKPVKCPNCGNEIAVDENSQYLSCGSCGKRYVNPYYVKNESTSVVEQSNQSNNSEHANTSWRCVSCNATLPSDDSSPTLTCPACGKVHKNPSYKPTQPAVVQESVKEEKAQANTVQNSTNNTSDLNWAYCPQCGNSLDLKNGRTEAYCSHCKKTFVKRTQNGALYLEERKQTVNVQQNIVSTQQNIVTAPAKVGESKFTGTYGSLLGNRIVNGLISLLTIGFGIPWVICRSYRWEVDHTVIDGRRLKFDGTGGKLIGSWIKWMFLTLITCGIYGLWVPLKKRAWIVEHSHIEGYAGESKFTGGLASFLGLQIVNFFILVFTLGLGVPWVVCRSMKWDSEHQIIDGRRIYFDGNAAQLFGSWIKWILLTFITCGFYGFLLPIKKQAWIVKHQSFVKPVGYSGQSMGNSGKLTDDSNQRKKTGKIVGCVIAVVVVAAIIVACVLFIPSITTWYTSEGLAYSVEIIEGTCFIRGIKDRTQTDIVIPGVIDGYTVTDISPYAFSGCTSLTSITISDRVTTIGDCAFDECGSLTSVTFGKNSKLITIGGRAFWGCDNLTSITIPDSVTTIGNYALAYCGSLTSITIPDSVTSIGIGSFSGCTSLTSITIPDSVTSIGSYAFSSCDSLTSIVIPASVTTIGKSAFNSCDSLTSIVIPDSVTTIGDYAFFYCTSLTDVYYEGTEEEWNSITIDTGNDPLTNATIHYNYVAEELQKYTFELNEDGESYIITGLGTDFEGTEVVIPTEYEGKPVTTIGAYAFNYCVSLTSVTIGNSVTSIGYGAFQGCGLTSIVIPDSVTSIGDYAFSGCRSLTSVTIGNSVTTIGDNAFYNCTSLTSVTIGNSVTTIGDNAFYNCTSLTSVTIGDSVTTIGIYAFYNCTRLTSIVIPDSVTSIGYSAFSHCTRLTSVIIGDSVTSIEQHAFRNCTSLTSITIPNSVTSIGWEAFEGCTSLTSITIPDSVTTINVGAFSGCTSLTDVYYTGTKEQWVRISISDDNYYLKIATIHYYYVNE